MMKPELPTRQQRKRPVTQHGVMKSWVLFEEAMRLIPCGTGTMSKAASIHEAEPAYIVQGKGCRVTDMDGNSYIDFRNGLGPVTLGYRFPAVDKAITAQLKQGLVFGGPHPIEVELARKLVDLIPAAECIRYLKTGGEAMAATFKIARAFTGKEMILSSGYHGWLASQGKGVPATIQDLHKPFPYGNIAAVDDLLKTHKNQVAAVSLSASYPHLTPNDSFPLQLRELTNRYGIPLIIDEIVTGFRLALGGFHEYYKFTPDLVVYSKGIANGMPLSVIGGRRDMMQVLKEGASVSSTFSGETLSLAAAMATIETYTSHPVIPHIWKMGELLQEGMNHIFKTHQLPIRSKGLPPCPSILVQSGDPSRDRVIQKALLRGLFKNGVSLHLVPFVNYSHQKSDIHETLEKLNFVCSHFNEFTRPTDAVPPSTPLLGAASMIQAASARS